MKEQRLLWAAVATTGLDPAEHPILEIYMRVTDMEARETFGVYYGILGNLGGIEGRCDKAVLEMHARSGLWLDMCKSALTPRQLGLEIEDALKELKGCEVYVAGYAPAFARAFIHEQTNHASEDYLHFQSVDVTSIEKFLNIAQGGEIYKRPYSARVKAKVDAAVEQYQFYLRMMSMLTTNYVDF
jgi:oligoribonuclease (3'-5' exoribonuclease)